MGSGIFLGWIIASMIYLALFSASGVMLSHTFFKNWRGSNSDVVTLQIPKADHRVEVGAAGTRLDTILRVLNSVPEIKKIKVLERQEIHRLLKPWVESKVLSEIPFPAVIEMSLSNVGLLTELKTVLAKIAPGILIEDHSKWLANSLNAIEGIEQLLMIIFGIVMTVTIVSVAFTVFSELSANKEVVEVMRLIGAKNSFIAKKFQIQLFVISLPASIIGSILAGLSMILLKEWVLLLFFQGDSSQLLAGFDILHWLILASIPIIYILICVIIAGISARVLLINSS